MPGEGTRLATDGADADGSARPPSGESPEASERRAFSTAVRALGRRPRSRAEIEALLDERGFPTAIVAETVARLRDRGWLDDAAVADAVMRDAGRRHLGSRRVGSSLARRGVEGDVAAAAAAASREADLEGARRALARRYPGGIGADPGLRARAVRWLLARGFPADVARRAIGADVDVVDD